MSLADRLAVLLSLLAFGAALLVTELIFERIPHIEDEIAYVWQAQAIAGGQLALPSPPHANSFLVPFVVDHEGLRFGKYPLGWPALLAIGVTLGIRHLVNPLLAGLGVWLTYRLGKKIWGETTGLLAAALTLSSPFFLMNSGSLLSHPFGLVLSAAFAIAWFDLASPLPRQLRNLATLTAGTTLGLLALTRPLTAIGVALPFGLHGLFLLARADWPVRRRVLAVGGIATLLSGSLLLWQYAVTGDPFLNPYLLWWPYDKVGFGPGYGVTESGHNLRLAYLNTRFSFWHGYHDLFGWGRYSWIFLPFGALAMIVKKNWRALLVSGVFPGLVLVYVAYWVGSWLFGPRYYYEGLYSLALLSAAGIAFLAGWPLQVGARWRLYTGWMRARPLAVTAILALLLSANLLFYTPLRLGGMHGLHGMQRADLQPFLTAEAQDLTPALVIVHPEIWMDYGVLLELADPFLDTPFIFTISRGSETDAALGASFPARNVLHYYPDEPYVFYTLASQDVSEETPSGGAGDRGQAEDNNP